MLKTLKKKKTNISKLNELTSLLVWESLEAFFRPWLTTITSEDVKSRTGGGSEIAFLQPWREQDDKLAANGKSIIQLIL